MELDQEKLTRNESERSREPPRRMPQAPENAHAPPVRAMPCSAV